MASTFFCMYCITQFCDGEPSVPSVKSFVALLNIADIEEKIIVLGCIDIQGLPPR